MNDLQKLMSVFQEVAEKTLDPVGKEDGDIDNDGDTDSSDAYLKNRRKKIGQAMAKDKTKKEGYGKTKKEGSLSDLPPAMQKQAKKKMEEGKVECPKCKGDGCSHCDDKGYHMKEYVTKEGKRRRVAGGDGRMDDPAAKMKESTLFSDEELAAIQERAGTQGPAGAPAEEFMSTSAPNDKKIYKDHEKGSDKKLEDYEDTSEKDASKAGRAVKSQSSARRGDNLKVGDNAMPTPTKAKGQ